MERMMNNDNIKTIDIKGKKYVEVSERIKYFNTNYPKGRIITEIVSNDAQVIVFKATVTPSVEVLERFFTGFAYEKESSSFINKTSYVENCETSAVGRALGMMGIGIVDSFASANEVQNAIKQQQPTPKTPPQARTTTPTPTGETKMSSTKQQGLIHILTAKLKWDDSKIYDVLQKKFEVDSTKSLTSQQASTLIEKLQKEEAKGV